MNGGDSTCVDKGVGSGRISGAAWRRVDDSHVVRCTVGLQNQ